MQTSFIQIDLHSFFAAQPSMNLQNLYEYFMSIKIRVLAKIRMQNINTTAQYTLIYSQYILITTAEVI